MESGYARSNIYVRNTDQAYNWMNKILIAPPFKEYLTYHPVSLRLHFSLVEQQSLREQCNGAKQSRFTPR